MSVNEMKQYDAVIIGGGPAGLSAALVLARACRSIAVIDAGTPRNSASPGVQGFLSRDGILPADLRKLSRQQIARYPHTEFIGNAVRQVRQAKTEQGFHVEFAGGETLGARAVILAVGMIDELPDIPGLRDHWGHRVIHCPFCHGFENRGRSWAVLANDQDDVTKALDLGFWSEDVAVIADRRLHIPEELQAQLSSRHIEVHQGAIRQLVSSGDGDLQAVEMQDGTRVPCGTVLHRPRQRQTGIVLDSNVALSESGRVWVDDEFQTSISGMFAAGDLTPGCQDVLSGAAEGAKAAKAALDLL